MLVSANKTLRNPDELTASHLIRNKKGEPHGSPFLFSTSF
ncbi:hypothetical protein VCRA2120E57_130064 [Vibrio crassostreae]|nr:hypothetical protein VCRA2120E57_130064 [Vibrio crassostreae]